MKLPWNVETKKVMDLISLGLILPSSIAVGLFIGYILDKALGTGPWLLLLFLLLGTASGIYNLLRGLHHWEDSEKKNEPEK